jgi:hypothetical protein
LFPSKTQRLSIKDLMLGMEGLHQGPISLKLPSPKKLNYKLKSNIFEAL